MLASVILAEARKLLKDAVQDSGGNYRWSDTDLLPYLVDARADLCALHPEAQYVDRVENPALSTTLVAGDTVGVTDRWVMPLAHYVAHLAFLEDSDDERNLALSNQHLNLYLRALK